MVTLDSIDKRLDRIERLLKNAPAPKKTWVSVSIITGLTEWTKAGMRKARENGLVKFRHEDGNFKYLLESLDQRFIIKNLKI